MGQRIVKMPDLLADQIAAGEVVEAPAAAVKELLENSLDAGATDIEVSIEAAGKHLIQLRDNGSGIAKEDLPLAITRHATSKLFQLEDLQRLCSMGFRGEALASLVAVAEVHVTSAVANANAYHLGPNENNEYVISEASHPVGTTVAIKNLFARTPVRLKFLKADRTELKRIESFLRSMALMYPKIAFRYSRDGKMIWHYPPAQHQQQVEQRIAKICGQEFMQHALFVEHQQNDMQVRAWVAEPAYTRSQSDLQYIFVNSRLVKDKLLAMAIRLAYRDVLFHGRYPAFILMLDLPPEQIDVNVHPTKSELRFREPRLVSDMLRRCIKEAIMKPGAAVQAQTRQVSFAPKKMHQSSDLKKHHGRSAASL